MSDEPTTPIQSGRPDPEPDLRFPTPQPPRSSAPRTLSRRRYATLVAFAEALIPPGGPIPHSASDVGVAERIDAALATFDPVVRRRFGRLLGLWEWLTVFSRYLRPFSRLPEKARTGVCERASRSRSPLHRNAFVFLKIMCLNQWASTPPVEAAIGFTYECVTKDPPRDGEALEVLSWGVIDRDRTEEADVVVI
ncbi:MAG: hypothetical protein ACRDKS_09875, partial [Actinomycetota bacterium]